IDRMHVLKGDSGFAVKAAGKAEEQKRLIALGDEQMRADAGLLQVSKCAAQRRDGDGQCLMKDLQRSFADASYGSDSANLRIEAAVGIVQPVQAGLEAIHELDGTSPDRTEQRVIRPQT